MASLWKQRGKKREEAGAGVGTPHGEEDERRGSGRRRWRRGLAGALTHVRRTRAARCARTGEGARARTWAMVGEAVGPSAMGSAQ
jgi:hypothetical protein